MECLVILLCVLLTGCASSRHPAPVAASSAQPPEVSLYERHIGVYRGYYDDLLAKPKEASKGRPYNRELIDAVHGDAAAAHRLFHSNYRTWGGEFQETWSQHCWVLLLKLGDDRFAELLQSEDPETRRLVGAAVSSYMQEDFPRTTQALRPAST